MAGKCGQTFRVECPVTLVGVEDVDCPPTSTERSVVIDAVETATGCPNTWEIGARLAPCSGEVAPSSALDLNPLANDQWADIPGFNFTAPEDGTYHITADVQGAVQIPQVTSVNRLIAVRLTLNGNPVAGTIRTVLQVSFALASGTQAVGENGTTTINKILQLAAGDVVQVQGEWLSTSGVGAPTNIGVGSPTASLLSYHKVAD